LAVDMHQNAYQFNELFFKETNRTIFITPANFIEQLKLYIHLLKQQ
jgi:hypothetical protein